MLSWLCQRVLEKAVAFTSILNLDFICFPDADRADPVEVEPPILNESTLIANVEEAFALEPVAATRRHKQSILKLCCIIQVLLEMLLSP